MIQYNKFKLNVGVRSRSVQKKLSDEETLSPTLPFAKKRSSQCKDSSTGDQSTMGFTDAFQDSPKANKGSIDRFSPNCIQDNLKLTKSLILSQMQQRREEENASPKPKVRTVPLYAKNIEEFDKSYQILKLYSSDSPSKKQRKLLTPLPNSRSPLQQYSIDLGRSHLVHSREVSNFEEHSSIDMGNVSNMYLTNVPGSFEDHYQKVQRQTPLSRNIRALSLSNSPKKHYLKSGGLSPIKQIISSVSPTKTPQQLKEEEEERVRQIEEHNIVKFDNLVKHRLQNQMIQLNSKEVDAFYNHNPNNPVTKDSTTISQKGQPSKLNIPYSLYLMKKDRDLLIERLKELHKEPKEKLQIVKENIIKEVKIKNLRNHQILDQMVRIEGEKYKEELLSKNPYKSTLYDVLALNQKSQSRVKARLAEELPMISRFNTQL